MRKAHITSARHLLNDLAEKHDAVVLSVEHVLDTTPFSAPRLYAKHGLRNQQYIQCYVGWSPNLMSEDVGNGLDFLQHHQDRNIIIQCSNGNIYAPALALAFMVSTNADLSINDCITKLKQQRPSARPDYKVIECADAHLGLNGALSRAVRNDPQFGPSRPRA